jgi:hypothetical protein
MNRSKLLQRIISTTLILGLVVGCSAPAVTPTPMPSASTPTAVPTPTPRADGLSHEEAATLSSLEQVDDYPLYTMRYYGPYEERASSAGKLQTCPTDPVLSKAEGTASLPAWACSLFAALGDADHAFGKLYGRNFDWEYSPALLLFTDPSDGYASVSMVDIAYFGFEGDKAGTITDLPLIERQALLYTPLWPFDGMNERGLAIGMAAVPPGDMRPDPNKETIDSLGVIREMLDHASNVDEALAILQGYNIDFGSGPPLHYLMADSSGRSLLVEFYQGEMVVIPNETPWHQATNFLRASAGEFAEGECWRYDKLSQRLTEAEGQLTVQDAMVLLADVSQGSTQWSVVYGMSSGDVNVVMGQKYDTIHTFHLGLAGE